MFTAAILTASDTASQGARTDLSTAVALEKLTAAGYTVAETCLLPDERQAIAAALTRMADGGGIHLIVTTGGTGLSPRDVTPQATLDVIDHAVPGIAEAIRHHSLTITPRAMLSRGVAGVRGGTLVVNLPGSPKAVSDCLDYILPTLHHGLETLTGQGRFCGEQEEVT